MALDGRTTVWNRTDDTGFKTLSKALSGYQVTHRKSHVDGGAPSRFGPRFPGIVAKIAPRNRSDVPALGRRQSR